MKNLQQTLTESVPHTPLKVWQALALLALLWVAPILLPDAIFANFAVVIFGIWVAGYFIMNRLIKHTIRASKVDIILIERFFILLSPLASAVIVTNYGVRHSFNSFIAICCAALWVITLLLVIGIILHIKNAQQYYHGVKKDELFK